MRRYWGPTCKGGKRERDYGRGEEKGRDVGMGRKERGGDAAPLPLTQIPESAPADTDRGPYDIPCGKNANL